MNRLLTHIHCHDSPCRYPRSCRIEPHDRPLLPCRDSRRCIATGGDRKALQKLVEAARVIDEIFITQLWSGNAALTARSWAEDKGPLGQARLHYPNLNKGPWSDLDDHEAFLPDVPPKKLLGANFYPEDLTRDEFETWVAKLPVERQGGGSRIFYGDPALARKKLYAGPL